MEPVDHQKYQIEVNKDLSSVEHFMKVLGSLFLFSLTLFFSTSLFSLVFRFIQLFISNLSKSYIFLIFNGILFLIVKNSGSVRDSSEEKFGGDSSEKYELCAEMKVEVAEEVVVMEVKESEPVKHEIVVLIEQQEQDDNLKKEEQEHNHEHQHEYEDEEQEQEDDLKKEEQEHNHEHQHEHEDEEQEQEHEKEDEEEQEMSREELNKKCEDFIRMMRHNIKVEAHQLRCYYA